MEKRQEKKKFGPSKRSFAPKSSVVYVGNLPYDVNEKDLNSLFSKFGRVRNVNLITTPGTDKSKGIAFITMLKDSDAVRAVKSFDGRVIQGRTIKCSKALERGEEPKKKLKGPSPQKRTKREEINQKREKRKSSLDRMFDNIGRR